MTTDDLRIALEGLGAESAKQSGWLPYDDSVWFDALARFGDRVLRAICVFASKDGACIGDCEAWFAAAHNRELHRKSEMACPTCGRW